MAIKPKNPKSLSILLFLALLFNNAVAEWLSHGGDIKNRRYASGELLINPLTVRNLKLKWKFFAGKDITATPAIANGVVYFPSWNGFLYAVNAFTGALIWQRNLAELTGLPATGRYGPNVTVSRSTPAIAGSRLIVGIYGPAVVIAVNRMTGQLLWSTRLDPRLISVVTASGTVYNGGFYVGVSSLENTRTSGPCCTFRGSLVKLDVITGNILWQTYTVPDNGNQLGGYSGASIWGSSPSIDIMRGHVYAATGQLYSAPLAVLRCQEKQNNQTVPSPGPDPCIGPDIHFDSILAFDMRSGRISWSRQLGGYDVFTFACLIPNNPDCPPGPNVDADFGEAPMMLTIRNNRRLRDVVVAVQKSGFAWALDRDNGDIVWFRQAGPGGLEGGGIWGAATDERVVYTNIVNTRRIPFRLAPSSQTTTTGAWVAMDANTGEILWTTANPSNETCHGPVTLTNGLLFAGSPDPSGPLYAMDARTGAILWSYKTGSTIYGGVSASYGCIYVGHGYNVSLATFHPTWNSGTSLYAFCIS